MAIPQHPGMPLNELLAGFATDDRVPTIPVSDIAAPTCCMVKPS